MSIRRLLDSELPFSGIASSIEDRNDYDMVILNREINSIWKSSRQARLMPDRSSWYLNGPSRMRLNVALTSSRN